MSSAPVNRAASVETTLVHGGAVNPGADAAVANRHAESWRIKGQFYRNTGGGAELATAMFQAAAALQRVVDQLREIEES